MEADTPLAAPSAVRAYAAFRAAEAAASAAASSRPFAREAARVPAPAPHTFRELYVEEFMSSFADELEATQRGGGADAHGSATADVRLLADCIKAGADAFTAEEQWLYG